MKMNLQMFGGSNLGQVMQSQIPGVKVDALFPAHFQVAATDAVAASNTAVRGTINASGDTTVVVNTGFTAPKVPRNISATAGGTAGDIKTVQVTLTGTNYNDEEVITEVLRRYSRNSVRQQSL